MFEVDVKNVTEEQRGGEGRRRGPARVWGSDMSSNRTLISLYNLKDLHIIFSVVSLFHQDCNCHTVA